MHFIAPPGANITFDMSNPSPCSTTLPSTCVTDDAVARQVCLVVLLSVWSRKVGVGKPDSSLRTDMSYIPTRWDVPRGKLCRVLNPDRAKVSLTRDEGLDTEAAKFSTCKKDIFSTLTNPRLRRGRARVAEHDDRVLHDKQENNIIAPTPLIPPQPKPRRRVITERDSVMRELETRELEPKAYYSERAGRSRGFTEGFSPSVEKDYNNRSESPRVIRSDGDLVYGFKGMGVQSHPPGPSKQKMKLENSHSAAENGWDPISMRFYGAKTSMY